MRRSSVLLCGVLCALVLSPDLRAQTSDTPEAAIRAMVTAMYSNDVAAYERVTLPHPQRARLTAGGRRNEDKLRQLNEDPAGLQIKMKRPLLFQGKEAKPAAGKYPVGTTGLYMVAHYGSPMVVPVIRKEDGWKIDLRWWVAMMTIANSQGPPPKDSPDFAIKSMLFEMLGLKRTTAATYLTDPKAVETLFLGAPRQREPSGVLEASVAEMPLVEVGPGEFFVMPSGKVIEGIVPTADRKVIVGLFGPSEMVFVVERVKNVWKIVAEPYFVILNG
jgi:hypothetical protein